MKRGQIAVFIILGIAVLCGVALLLYLRGARPALAEDSVRQGQSAERVSQQVKSFVEDCMSKLAQDALFNRIGPQGGYIDPSGDPRYGEEEVSFSRQGNVKVAYWYKDGDISPSIDKVGRKLGRFLLVETRAGCFNFSQIESLKNVEISVPDINYSGTFFKDEGAQINVSINDNDVSINYFLPVEITMAGQHVVADSYHVTLPVAYGSDFRIMKDVMSRMMAAGKGGYNMELGCRDFSRNGYTNVYYFNNVIKLLDYETYIDLKFKRTFEFQFAFSGLGVYGYCSG